MISLSPINNSSLSFGKGQKTENKNNKTINSGMSLPRLMLSTAAFLLCLNTTSPATSDTFTRESNNIEMSNSIKSEINPTQLSSEELEDAPTPIVTIAGKKEKVGIVVDLESNKLYRYDSNGSVIDGYHVASGKKGRNGKSITGTGIRRVHHIENYPYRGAVGSKRSRNPKAYGPNILYLTIINPKTGEEEGSNGEFIHGNNNSESIGNYASHGCIRMDNEVIKQFAKEVNKGTLVLIK